MRQVAVRVVMTVLGLWLVVGLAGPAVASSTPTAPPGIPTDGTTYETPPASTTTSDALIIIAFSVIAMAGLVLVIRAGLKSVASEDD